MDYSHRCWNCGKLTMELKGEYYQCTECGATWNKQPELTSFVDYASDNQGTGGTKSAHPKISRGRRLPPLTAGQQASRRRYK